MNSQELQRALEREVAAAQHRISELERTLEAAKDRAENAARELANLAKPQRRPKTSENVETRSTT